MSKKKFPDQQVIDQIKANYNLPKVGIWGVEEGEVVEYDDELDYEFSYYYDEDDNHAEFDKEGNLVYSDIDWIKY